MLISAVVVNHEGRELSRSFALAWARRRHKVWGAADAGRQVGPAT
jgi:hypothetical protein